MISDSKRQQTEFYKEFRVTNPSLVIGLIIITLGVYIIPWLYTKNKEFEMIDPNAPDPRRAFVILLMFPISWAYITLLIQKLIAYNLATQILEIVGWLIIGSLIMKYCYDFALSFGRITKTNGFLWFLLMIIPFVTIPAMQSELNSHFDNMEIRKKSNNFYR